MNYKISTLSQNGNCILENEKVVFIATEPAKEAFFRAEVDFTDWEEDAFIFMPACAYNGNRIKKINRPYPSVHLPEEYGVNAEELINNVPALNIDGSGEIDVTSGDMALPCAAVFYRKAKKVIFVFTEQSVKSKNIGYCVKAGKITISFPAHRKVAYRFDAEWLENPDTGIEVKKDEKIEALFLVKEYDCADIAEFYELYFKLRRKIIKCDPLPNMYTPELWDLVMANKNAVSRGDAWKRTDNWGCGGWCGGYMETVARVKSGDELTRKNAICETDFNTIPEHLAPSGFFYYGFKDGAPEDRLILVRKNAETLYYLFKMFDITEPKQQWIDAARKVTDALYNLFERYGKFGYKVDARTGDLVVGCGDGGSAGISALARAGVFFKEQKYIDTAKKAGDYYYAEFMRKGYTSTGPGDALSAPDSESAFALFESYVVLYEVTNEEKWLECAKACGHYCSSWVVSYTYKFPEGTEFYNKKINTVGSVYANVQNKHAAPGICTSSGDYIYRLYKYTNDLEYLEFIRDIAFFIPQCMATPDRMLKGSIVQPCVDPAACLGYLPLGEINERVNLSDWEGADAIGNIFSIPTWSTQAFIMTYGELITNKEFVKDVEELL